MKAHAVFQRKITLKYQRNIFSEPIPLGPFQPNLAQSILCWKGFNFFSYVGVPSISKGKTYRNSENALTKSKNRLFQNHWTIFNQTSHKAYKGLFNSQKWINDFFLSINIIVKALRKCVSQGAICHGPIVWLISMIGVDVDLILNVISGIICKTFFSSNFQIPLQLHTSGLLKPKNGVYLKLEERWISSSTLSLWSI